MICYFGSPPSNYSIFDQNSIPDSTDKHQGYKNNQYEDECYTHMPTCQPIEETVLHQGNLIIVAYFTIANETAIRS